MKLKLKNRLKSKKINKNLVTASVILVLLAVSVFSTLYVMDKPQTYSASVSTVHGETISLQVMPMASKPSVWTLAWRVGTTQVSTINIGLTVTPAGTNIANPRLTYYIKAVDGLTSGKVIEATNYTVPLGVQFSNSTGNINIDTHLQSLGLYNQ